MIVNLGLGGINQIARVDVNANAFALNHVLGLNLNFTNKVKLQAKRHTQTTLHSQEPNRPVAGPECVSTNRETVPSLSPYR